MAIQFIPQYSASNNKADSTIKNFVCEFYTLSVVETMIGQRRENLLQMIVTNLRDPGKARPASKTFICSGGA